ncbi:N-acetylmuramoyl-L-alanine amidase [Paenibacillus radicis (ex Xue et al. 2023)]|uniref:N-acetylmuramoyl-L-alanine amidase n=1 Tax=Paenibacillus radicis (ex Xue et al. 2023) TaxID=2972489 RepID=A0ABT1YML2_9BACL|nr:N-acetylmuramoyl-L-alanine amidase [Paenibacillus radicis (ex Xue et al. 2023)]MCR8634418.1 N-acetylmuramoyl-L-alanine amidase [Paenibacillus radicis (ex Xue et al. 2023)]
MQFFGIVIHHSICPSINGKGYDFFITRNGSIIPSSEQTDPLYIHICLEGDFSDHRHPFSLEEKEQFFLLNKLVLRLADTFKFQHDDIFPHTISCPGAFFPWSQLVISSEDRYH